MDNTLSVISTLAAASLVAVLAVQCINSGVEGFAEDSESGIPEVGGAVPPPVVSPACSLLPVSSSLLPNEEWTTDDITLPENPLMMGMNGFDIIGSDPGAGSLSLLSQDIRGSYYPVSNTQIPFHLSGKCLQLSPSIFVSTADSLDAITTTNCGTMNDPTKM